MAELYQTVKEMFVHQMSVYLVIKVSEGFQAPTLSTIVASFSQFSRSFVEVF